MGKLYGSRVYLAGAMDRVQDNGTGWRQALIPFCCDRGIVMLNPCDKPIEIGLEGIEDKKRRRSLKTRHRWQTLSGEVKLLRVVDLRMVDSADFIICNLDTEVHACGTYEELFWANRMKRPILIHCEQGIEGVPDWLFGTLPYKLFFDSWDKLKRYVARVDDGKDDDHLKRWLFFDYSRLTPEGQREYYKKTGQLP